MMDIKNVVSLYFSPTSSTHGILEEMAKFLPWPVQELDITDYSANDGEYSLACDELLLAGVPVYGGRVPAVAAQRIRNIRGSGGPAIVVTVFGNRAYDDALIEMKDLLEEQGFVVISALAAVAEHNIMRSVGRGRPDAEDLNFIRNFTEASVKKLRGIKELSTEPSLEVKGTKPYRPYNTVPLKPQADSSCTSCGDCAEKCPVHAIPEDKPMLTEKDDCITCMRCVKECPTQSRSLNSLALAAAEKLFAFKNRKRKEPEGFL